MGRGGFEPPMFLLYLFYRQASSPTRLPTHIKFLKRRYSDLNRNTPHQDYSWFSKPLPYQLGLYRLIFFINTPDRTRTCKNLDPKSSAYSTFGYRGLIKNIYTIAYTIVFCKNNKKYFYFFLKITPTGLEPVSPT